MVGLDQNIHKEIRVRMFVQVSNAVKEGFEKMEVQYVSTCVVVSFFIIISKLNAIEVKDVFMHKKTSEIFANS